MSNDESYVVRLKQLQEGSKEFYEGELKIITKIVANINLQNTKQYTK